MPKLDHPAASERRGKEKGRNRSNTVRKRRTPHTHRNSNGQPIRRGSMGRDGCVILDPSQHLRECGPAHPPLREKGAFTIITVSSKQQQQRVRARLVMGGPWWERRRHTRLRVTRRLETRSQRTEAARNKAKTNDPQSTNHEPAGEEAGSAVAARAREGWRGPAPAVCITTT